jgi:serine/threonine protein kinase
MISAVRRPTVAGRPTMFVAPPNVAPGIMLGGKYRLEEAIARGGMARVWRAQHVMLNRPVAVKFLDAVGESQTETFLHEAKVAASVRHKNVVDIIDFGLLVPPGGGEHEPYMVMELLEGETLDDRLFGPAMTVSEIVAIAVEALSGLDAVHRASIIHRDLKPANIFLTAADEGVFVRLLDFGISQDADWEEAGTKMIVGTPEYMSPEQAAGAPLDLRTDIYSFGVVLYEMFSGVLPCVGSNPREILAKVVSDTPAPLSWLRPDIPEIAAVVERAMERGPSDRWAGAREMRLALLAAVGSARDSGELRASSLTPRPQLLEFAPEAPTLEHRPSPPVSAPFDALPRGLRPWSRTTRAALALGVLAIAGLAALAVALDRSAVEVELEATPPAALVAPIVTAPIVTAPMVTAPIAVAPITTPVQPATLSDAPSADVAAPAPPAAPTPAVRARARDRVRSAESSGEIRRELDF